MANWNHGDNIPDILRKILQTLTGTGNGGVSVPGLTVSLADGVRMGGYSKVVIDNTAVGTAAYVAGDSVGGLRTLDLARANGTGVVLQNVTIYDEASQAPEGTLLFFNAEPTASTTTDADAFVLAAADADKLIGAVPIVSDDYAIVNAGLNIGNKNGIGLVLQPAAGTEIYCVFVTSGTPDFVAATDFALHFGVLQD